MSSNKYINRSLKSLITFISITALLLAIFHFFKLTVNIDSGRDMFSEQITSVIGRETQISGDVKLTISLFPKLLVQQIKINNPDGFSDEGFITVSEASVAVSLLPLLTGQFHFTEIMAEQAKINLIQKKDGSDNWTFGDGAQSAKPGDTKSPAGDTTASIIDRLSVSVFELTNVEIKYSDEEYGLEIHDQLEQIVIDMNDRENPRAEVKGKIQGFPYNINFTMDDLELFHSGSPWLIHGEGHIAKRKTKLEASLQSGKKEITGNVDIKIKKVDLGHLLEVMEIVSGQNTRVDNVAIKVKLHGSDIIELCQQAEIELLLNEGYWILPATATGENKKLSFTSASSFTCWEKPVKLHLTGNLAGEAIKLDFKTNRLSDFFDDMDKLDVNLVSNIVDTDIILKGKIDLPIDTNHYDLKLSVKSSNLEKLNPIIDAEFPPIKNFSLSGHIIASKNSITIKSAAASIGETHLEASIDIDKQPATPLWNINLSSRQLQLKDFAFIDESTKQIDSVTTSSTEKSDEEVLVELTQTLENLVRDPENHINLDLKVDKVLSGEDHLGSGKLQFHLSDNSIQLKNADIETPGGRITGSLLLEVKDNAASGHAKLDIDKLDYGIVSRLFEPASKVDGIISTRVDLQLGGNNFTRLLDNSNGQLDIVIWPKGRKPVKALKLWTTNLFFMILPELSKKHSKTNCALLLANVDNGNMKEQLLIFDTTDLWLYGNIEVDFKQEHLQLSLFPHAKKSRIFSLEAPMRIAGNFSDIHLVTKPGDLALSTISFVTSPLFSPMLMAFGDDYPEDGSARCEQLFDREYVKGLKAKLEKQANEEIEEMLRKD